MAKRVKWAEEEGIQFSRHYWAAELDGDNELLVGLEDDGFLVDLCFCKKREFKTLKAAKRYCIREARKLHKVVGTQLDQLAKEAE